jgi:pimeloyl-ACP methyl ester carboxylesterase
MPRPLPVLAGVEHHFIDLPGHRMHVADSGSGDPVLLLHGWPQNWWEWRRLVPRMSESFRVICPDFRGCGWSDVPRGGYDKETLATDVLALMDHLELPKVRLIGHDIGGYVAFLICLKAPERITHCLTLNTGHPFTRPVPPAILTFWRFWYWPLLGAPVLGPWVVRHGVFPRLLRRWFTADRAGWSTEDAEIFDGWIGDPAHAVASSKLYRSYLLRDSPGVLVGRYRTERLIVPTLMLHGTEDRILRLPFLGGYEPYAEDMRVEAVPGAGHFVGEEMPELVAERALDFFVSPS